MASAHGEALLAQERTKKSPQPIETVTTEELEIDITKHGMLEALNHYAAHSDKTPPRQ
jgi:hypothetical protein